MNTWIEPTAASLPKRRSQRPPFANALFFPAASLYGALIIPVWVLGLLGPAPVLPGLAGSLGHAHEMLFGYALAVVVGYLLGPQPALVTLSLLASWVLARLGFLLAPGTWLAWLPALLFAVGAAWRVVPRFSLAAKQWRNKTLAPLVAALASSSILAAVWIGSGWVDTEPQRALLLLMQLLLAMLMFFMGGRIIAPAVAGHVLRQGRPATARVQPALEALGLLGFLLALLLTLLLQPPFTPAVIAAMLTPALAALLLSLGLLVALRLLRWQLWLCVGRADLLLLGLGYLWLVAGLLLTGLAMLLSWPTAVGAHALMMGAMGSLTLIVMARTRLLYRFRDANASALVLPAALLMSTAAVIRLLLYFVDFHGNPDAFVYGLLVSAGCWSLAQLLLLLALLRTWRWRSWLPD